MLDRGCETMLLVFFAWLLVSVFASSSVQSRASENSSFLTMVREKMKDAYTDHLFMSDPVQVFTFHYGRGKCSRLAPGSLVLETPIIDGYRCSLDDDNFGHDSPNSTTMMIAVTKNDQILIVHEGEVYMV